MSGLETIYWQGRRKEMKTIRSHAAWLGAVALGIFLVGAAVGLAGKEAGAPLPSTHAARELSAAFRNAAKEVLPSMVVIETRGKAVRVNGELRSPFDDEESPFGDLFRNNPELREFFRNRPRQMPAPRGMGSGFIIDSKGVILTNSHVVQNAAEVKVRLYDGREFTGTDIKTDPRSDVAVVHINATGLQPVRMGNSNNVEIGDWVLAVGSPFGLDMSVTAGIISAKGRGPGINQREDYLQTDAAINPGNSGGPLVNLEGEVIGINTAISSRSGGYEGIGFTIPIDMARWVADQLVSKGQVSRAYLGVGIQPVDASIAKKFQVPVGEGALVNMVGPKSPAADAKVELADIVLELNGQKVTNPRNLQGIVEQLEVGKSYPMVVMRNGEKITLSVTMGAMPENYGSMIDEKEGESTPEESRKENFDELGLDVRELTPELAKQLDMPEGSKGVVIGSVKDDSPAERAGLRAGLVIERVGKTTVTTPEEFKNAMKEQSLKEGISLLVRSGAGSRFIVIQSAN